VPDLEFVHRFVPSPSGSSLTLLMLHGTGGDERDLLHLGRELSSQAALLSPRGRVLENGMPRFFRRFAEGVFDINDLTEQTHALARFVEGASNSYGLDPKTIVAVGYSNGANIAGSSLILHPETLAGAVLFRPMVPFVPDRMPGLSGKPILILAGRRDGIVSMEETERLAALAKQAGAGVSLHVADATHAITGDEVRVARDWISSHFPEQAKNLSSE
jgi:predicted esterase